MKTSTEIVILVALCALVAGAVALKQEKAPVESRGIAAAGAVGAPGGIEKGMGRSDGGQVSLTCGRVLTRGRLTELK